MSRFFGYGSFALLLLAGSMGQAESLKSGPQVGDQAQPFEVRDVTGPHAGEELCYRCKFGNAGVVSIFTRELSEPVVAAIKELDMKVAQGDATKAFVVFMTDDADKGEKRLRMLAEKEGLKNVPLTLTTTQGPKNYMINKDAGVTVLLWKEGEIVANHAFAKDEFCPKCHKMVIGELAKLDQ